MKNSKHRSEGFAIPASTQARLLKIGQMLLVKKGQIIVERGDQLSGVFWLLSGRLSIFSVNKEGREAVLYSLSPGEICLLSLRSALSNLIYPAWVKVESRTAQVVILRENEFREAFKGDPGLQDLVFQCISTTVRDLLIDLDSALLGNLKERIYSFLLYHASGEGEIEITHGEIARHLGTSREVVSREISSLKRKGLVRVFRGKLLLQKNPG